MVARLRRGEVYWASLDPAVGSEMRKTRPVIVVQNDVGNAFSPLTIVVPVSSRTPSREHPFLVCLPDDLLPKPSTAHCNHVRAIDKSRLKEGCAARLDEATMAKVDDALRASLGLY